MSTELGYEGVAELNRLLVVVAETHPGLVAKLRMIVGEIEADPPPPRTLFALVKVLRALAGGLDVQANQPLAPADQTV